tara:strand:+ start:1142 stop:1543 length:402 start_codon:yes stop_codon:yes gene_type:complete
MFFFGIILVVHGIYEEKFQKIKNNVKIQYRFVPRSYYDEQVFSSQFSSKFSNIFDEDQDEWSANQRTFTPYNIDKQTMPVVKEVKASIKDFEYEEIKEIEQEDDEDDNEDTDNDNEDTDNEDDDDTDDEDENN